MDKMRIFRNLNMRLIKGLLLALASTTVMHGMEGLPVDDGVVSRAAPLIGEKRPPRVVPLDDGSMRSDTPFRKDVSFDAGFSGALTSLFSRISEHSARKVIIAIPGFNAEGGTLNISVATEIKRQLAEYEVSMASEVSGLKEDINAALKQLGAMLEADGFDSA